MTKPTVRVIGAGLAGCEAAWQLAEYGMNVKLYEMKPKKYSPAHNNPNFAELVCSNSLRSNNISNAVGLLKEEMRHLNSIIMKAADNTSVPAGGALAVDRTLFSEYISDEVKKHKNIEIINEEYTEIIDDGIFTIIATGPLTSESLAQSISNLNGLKSLAFYDAAAPIISADSIDMSKAFKASRYGKGTDDYINCPMTRDEYYNFVNELINAENAPVHGFEEKSVFEGCMPVESMAKRGLDTLAFGPLKPVGLIDPNTNKQPFAVVQLRAENREGTMYNIVGFQTKLKFGEQKRVFSLIPGLENLNFERYGVMHRNTFIHSPGFLDKNYWVINNSNLAFAGQITGVEGYVESAASGLLCGLVTALKLKGINPPVFTSKTAIGAMAKHVSSSNHNFQPMNCSFGLIDSYQGPRIKNKIERYTKIAEESLAEIKIISDELCIIKENLQ